MKKLVSVLFALLLVGSFAFADVAVGAWGRFIYSPMASVDGGDQYSFSAPSWANGGRVGFNVKGTSDNAGFAINVDSNGNTLGVGDNAKIWVKLNDMITLQGGKVQGDVLRGKIGDSGTLNAIDIAVGATGEDAIFQRFYPQHGLLVDITPAEGVYLGVALDTNAADEATRELTEDTFKKIQLGAGYVIPELGHLRAQYVGNVDDAAKYVNVAFAFTGMEGLLLDVGAKIQLEADVAQNTVAFGATYGMDALSVVARGNVGIGEDADGDDMSLGASVDLAYTVAAPLAVGVEGSFAKRDTSAFSFLPYGKMGFGNGYAKAGFLYSSDDGTSSWAIPIVLEYWF